MDALSPSLKAAVAAGKHGFRPQHTLGQNFITDEAFLAQLLDDARLDETDRVLEIGPGFGIMTAMIASRAERVLAVEADQRLAPILEEVLSDFDNAEFVIGDALKTNLSKLLNERFAGKPYRVIANLPYYITADLILKMLATDPLPETICVMVQKEAAERLMSKPGDKNWGALAATVNYYCDCTVLENVPPHRFNPAPHVDSCFIRLDIKTDRIVAADDERALVRLIQACFLMRRKTLANNLKSAFGVPSEESAEMLRECGLSEKVRGEVLTIEQIADLLRVMKNHGIIRN